MKNSYTIHVHISNIIFSLLNNIKTFYSLEKDADAVRYSFDKAYDSIGTINWKDVSISLSNLKFDNDTNIKENSSKSFNINNAKYNVIYNSICNDLNLSKPRSSYITKLVLTHTYISAAQFKPAVIDEIKLLQTIVKCLKIVKEQPNSNVIDIVNKFINDIDGVK